MSVVGIDIGKATFVACFKKNKILTKETFDNAEPGFQKLSEWIDNQENSSLHYCMESTGKYGYALAHHLYHQNKQVSIVNACAIKYYGKSLLMRNKTDKVDAELIAQFCEARKPALWTPKPENIRILGSLVKRVEQLTLMKIQETNRLEAENNATIIKSIESTVELFDHQIKQLEASMQKIIEEDEALSSKAKLLSSIKGVGNRTIHVFLANFGDIEKFSHPKQLCAFIGLNPGQRQSGTSLNSSSMSKMGNPYLRKMLYMPTLCATVHNPLIRDFYQRLVDNGKPKKVAVCAAMRKLVYIMYGVLKNNAEFDPNYSKSI